MDEEYYTDTDGQLHSKSISCESSNTYAVGDHQTKESDDERASKKACFLRDNGENKIVVRHRLRQLTELGLCSLKQTFAG